jgi:hypothetical protein
LFGRHILRLSHFAGVAQGRASGWCARVRMSTGGPFGNLSGARNHSGALARLRGRRPGRPPQAASLPH